MAMAGPRRRAALLDELARGVGLGSKLAASVVVMIFGAGVYGAVIGAWTGGAQIAWAALKLPLVLIVTAAATMPFNWMSALLLGLEAKFAQVAALSFLVLAAAAVVLASLSPVAWLFTVSAPLPSFDARLTHNVLYLLHTLLVGSAGLAGMAMLWRTLERLAGDRWRARRVFGIWVLAFALVGGEVAWALRPFVGSVFYPEAFLRPDALDGNVYEFIWNDILPYLFETD